MAFRPPLEAYDVLIHLVPRQVPLLAKAVDPPAITYQQGTFRDDPLTSGGILPVIDYDPVRLYLSELRVCVIFNSLLLNLFPLCFDTPFKYPCRSDPSYTSSLVLFRMHLETWLCFSMTRSVEP